ncbi:hypothetical protein EPA93_36290 [Ktedonosporobacter rubrisoli]|uniref:Uncharacterized protein n=1 Tax=Ktedonosporobacter rubrisoli TaxID=2509675 RepID=A0A4P6K032_KTERU|nr:hypothetical protein [Ktedonosporobacter rubrisoli]QBD81143.1 hypothetical protein EPA93_36290 [Ktedonosporobacter rubrisoli]
MNEYSKSERKPSRQTILIVLDALSRAKIVQPIAHLVYEKEKLRETIRACETWLEHHKVAYHYDETCHMYVLDLPVERQEGTEP